MWTRRISSSYVHASRIGPSDWFVLLGIGIVNANVTEDKQKRDDEVNTICHAVTEGLRCWGTCIAVCVCSSDVSFQPNSIIAHLVRWPFLQAAFCYWNAKCARIFHQSWWSKPTYLYISYDTVCCRETCATLSIDRIDGYAPFLRFAPSGTPDTYWIGQSTYARRIRLKNSPVRKWCIDERSWV